MKPQHSTQSLGGGRDGSDTPTASVVQALLREILHNFKAHPEGWTTWDRLPKRPRES